MTVFGGAAADFAQRNFGGVFETKTRVVSVGTGTVAVLANDANRIGYQIFNIGVTDITANFFAPVVTGEGLLLLGNGAHISAGVRDDANIPGLGLFAISDAAGGSLFVAEFVQAFEHVSEGE